MMDLMGSETCRSDLILCVLNFYTTQILTSKFCIFECISRLIKVIDYHNARWKPETKRIHAIDGITSSESASTVQQYYKAAV